MHFDKVMNMKTTLTITSKGQTTIPAAIRKKLGIPKTGGKLQVTFDEHNNAAVISKRDTIEELSEQASKYIKPGSKPVTNVDEYYQKHRNSDT